MEGPRVFHGQLRGARHRVSWAFCWVSRGVSVRATHGLFVGCPWRCYEAPEEYRGAPVGFPRAIRGKPMARQWGFCEVCRGVFVYKVSMRFSWVIRGLSVGSPWGASCRCALHGMSVRCLWVVRGLSVDSPWGAHAMFMGCHGAPMGCA